MRCRNCGISIPSEATKCANCGSQIAPRRGMEATVGFAAGQAVAWLKTRPWVAAGLGMVLLVALIYDHFESPHRQQMPKAQAPAIPSQTRVESPRTVSNETMAAPSATQAQSGSLLTTEGRQRMAKALEHSFTQQDLDITAVAAGEGNDTLIFTSEMFNDVNQRVVFMRRLRTNWEKELCKSGFKQINLSNPGLLGDTQEFTLRCPKTAQERADFATSTQHELNNEGNATTVSASGTQREVLVYKSNSFATEEARKIFFGMLREKMRQPLCDYGFRTVELGSDNLQQSNRFSLACPSTP